MKNGLYTLNIPWKRHEQFSKTIGIKLHVFNVKCSNSSKKKPIGIVTTKSQKCYNKTLWSSIDKSLPLKHTKPAINQKHPTNTISHCCPNMHAYTNRCPSICWCYHIKIITCLHNFRQYSRARLAAKSSRFYYFILWHGNRKSYVWIT